MAAQTLLAKLGLRLSAVGSAASLAIAMPVMDGSYDMTAHTAANRTGLYGDQTTSAEKLGFVVGGQQGPIMLRASTIITLELPASVAGAAPLNITEGATPTSPNNGDIWTTSLGMYAQIAGATVGPFGAGSIGGSIAVNQVAYGSGANTIHGTNELLYTTNGGLQISPAATTSNTNSLNVIPPASTGVNFGSSDIRFALDRTLTFATGSGANQYGVDISAPTYAGVGGSTLTNAATVVIEGAPIQGSNMTITNTYALWVQGGKTLFNGTTLMTPTAVTSGIQTAFTITGAANTGMTASTEVNDVNFALNRTVQWATGPITTQRSFFVQAPTFAAVGASVITSAATVAITGAPIAGANVTITTPYALWIESGLLGLSASLTTGATFNIPQGSAPATPNNGDIWTTSTGVYAQIAGATVGPFGAGGGISGSIAIHQVAYGAGTNAIAGSATLVYGPTTGLVIAPTVVTTGIQTAFTLTGAINTGQTSNTEAIDVNFNLARTITWATQTPTTNRAFRIQAPTYACNTATSTFNAAYTVFIDGPPLPGSNVLITSPYTLYINAGVQGFAGSGFSPFMQAASGFYFSNDSSGQGGWISDGMYPVSSVWTFTPAGVPGSAIGIWNGGVQVITAPTGTGGGAATTTLNLTIDNSGRWTAQPTAATNVAIGGYVFTGAADTNMSASTEIIDFNLNMSHMVQWAGGALAVQRSIVMQGPTLAFTGASTVTTAATLAISNSPAAGTNATITSSYSLWIQGGRTPIFATQSVATTGSPSAFTLAAGAHTTLTASTEAIDVNFNLARTVQFGTGALTTQRAHVVQAPTYAFVGASVITNAATVSITGSPVAGANATITTSTALWLQAGRTLILGTQTVSTSGSPSMLTFNAAAHTTLTLSTEAIDVNFNLARTVQFATGALATQRAVVISAPTYAFVGASTLTTAATLTVAGSPLAGTNATITNQYALWINGGRTCLNATQTVQTTGSPTMILMTGAAHTTLTLSTEAIDVNFNLARTVQFATGALATQRAFLIQAPTYAFVGASTLATAATVAISGSPAAGANATITTPISLWIQGGANCIIATQTAVTSGASPYIMELNGANHTGLTSTEATDILFSLAGHTFTSTVPVTNRAVLILAPSYASSAVSQTITTAATLAISAAPTAGSNVTITNPYALWIQAGASLFTGGIVTGLNSALITSIVAMTGGSTANVPTLTSGPLTGNPTKWIPISDNGTTRYIPCW